MTKKISLLMTASINPKDTPGGMFSVSEREKMYIDALLFYINELETGIDIENIIFCENSGHSLKKLTAVVPPKLTKNVEFLQFNSAFFDNSRGKGYNEQLMIDMAVEQSLILKKSTHFFKVTGRYRIHNISMLMKEVMSVEGVLNLFCDQKDVRILSYLYPRKKYQYGETRFYCVGINFYKNNFMGRYKELDLEKSAENLMFEIAKQNYQSPSCRFRFHKEAEITASASIPLHFLGLKIQPTQQPLFWSVYIPVSNTLRSMFPSFWF